MPSTLSAVTAGCLVSCCLLVLGAEPDKIQSEKSSSGALVADHYFSGPDLPRKIFIRDVSDAGKTAFLAEYERNAEVLFAPDDRWLVINDNAGSNISTVRLFKRGEGLAFVEVPERRLSERAWAFLARIVKHGARVHLDHMYVNALRWSGTSRSLLLVLWGHSDRENYVDCWYCVYDIPGDRLSLDLRAMNAGSARISGH